MKILQYVTPIFLKMFKTFNMMMWHANPHHIILRPCNIHVKKINYKLPNATCHYPKQLKNIHSKFHNQITFFIDTI
jgi:hypothetical protein